MKKNISINLQGIIFHIEEDGYEQLSNYLASIRTYFSTYEGHEEIIADIEARIAEIFAARLSPGKQVITLEDVQSLIAQMGNVSDFEQTEPVLEEAAYATLAEGPAPGSTAGTASATGTSAATGTDTGTASGYQGPETETATGPKKLYRDLSQKVISGVSAGLANYLGVDPLWIRLLFVFLLVLAPFTAGLSIAFVLAGYIILWVSLPVNYNLPESNIKKLFRDPLDKKLGGVASGIAKFFGLDVTIVRILFLASVLLGGTGLLVYFVLWVAVPEAVTLTEKMQMQGSPVTLSGIEETLKENLRFKDENGEETATAKALLLPLRILSQLLTWLGRVLGSFFSVLITLIRIVAGIILIAVSTALAFGLFISLLVAIGAIDNHSDIWMSDFPVSVFLQGFPQYGLIAGFVVGVIPALLLFLLAISLLARRFFLRPVAGWSMFAVWLVSVFALVTAIALHTRNFSHTGETEIVQTIPAGAYQTLILDANNARNGYGKLRMEVQGHKGSDLEVRQHVEARGRTEEDAKQNARMISYQIDQRDSLLRFDNRYTFKPGAAFREQRLNLTLLVPESKQVRVTKDFVRLLSDSYFEGNYSREKIARNTWQVQGEKFVCLTCAADTLSDQTASSDFVYRRESEAVAMRGSALMSEQSYGSNLKNYNFTGFTRVAATGPYHLQLIQGDSYAISVRGDEEALKKIRISKDGNELEIEPQHNLFTLFENQNPLLIQVTMPKLRSLELTGAIKADVADFRTDNFDLTMAGAIKSTIHVIAKTINVEMAGASQTTLTGSAKKLKLDMVGASSLDAANLQAEKVVADISGACKADIFALRALNADASGASKIRYKGNPADVTSEVTGAGKMDRF